jgi:hypothetical protein
MSPSARPGPARRAVRRIKTVVRSLSPAALVAVTLALVLGGAGLASAANGGSFILGKSNSETATAKLSNTTGTPLSLSAPVGKAPLAVNSTTQVNNLNAQFTGGMTAGQLQSTGGVGFAPPNSDIPINSQGEVVATTGPLPAGVYYVNASALIQVAAGDLEGICEIQGPSQGQLITAGGEDREGIVQASETAPVGLSAGDTLREVCFTRGNHGSVVDDAGITAIRIQSSHQGPAVQTGHPVKPLHLGR